MPRKSFYDLAFFAAPGGAHQDVHYVRATLDEVRADLAGELAHGLSLYLLCWYGAELSLNVVQTGAWTASIDLRPFLTLSITGYPDITFDAQGKVVGYDFRSAEEADVAEGTLAAKMFSDDLGEFSVTIDWDAIEVPSLEGDIVAEGDLVSIDGDWFDDEDQMSEQDLLDEGYVPYGFTDREA